MLSLGSLPSLWYVELDPEGQEYKNIVVPTYMWKNVLLQCVFDDVQSCHLILLNCNLQANVIKSCLQKNTGILI